MTFEIVISPIRCTCAQLIYILYRGNRYKISRTITDKKNQKHVVEHIKKFAYVKKKQYLCIVKTREIINIILLVIVCILANLVIARAILRIAGIA